MPTLKLSDALFQTAEAAKAIGKAAGLDLKLTDIYHEKSLESLALIAGLLRELAEQSGKCKIEITNE